MNEKPFFGIQSIDKKLLDAVVEQNGRIPDNFVDSAEGSWAFPDPSEHPGARRLLEQIDTAAQELLERRRATGETDGPAIPGAA